LPRHGGATAYQADGVVEPGELAVVVRVVAARLLGCDGAADVLGEVGCASPIRYPEGTVPYGDAPAHEGDEKRWTRMNEARSRISCGTMSGSWVEMTTRAPRCRCWRTTERIELVRRLPPGE
jgi:hypothetical protein